MRKRIKTYINGLDEQLNGGVPEGHVVLLSGMPGSMKSSVAYNILHYNAKEEGTRGVYVTLEQSRESLLEHMHGLSMNSEEIADKVTIVDMGYLRLNAGEAGQDKNWLEIFKMYTENLKKSAPYDILVIDSLPILEILGNVDNRRLGLFELFAWLRGLAVTTFIISEMPADLNVVHEEDFLADGIIRLRKERNGPEITRQIVIEKMRSTKHNTAYFALIHNGQNFQITKLIGNSL